MYHKRLAQDKCIKIPLFATWRRVVFHFHPGISDYVNSSKATTKDDVYSFGVMLIELVTGKKTVEAEFGENKEYHKLDSKQSGHKRRCSTSLGQAFVRDIQRQNAYGAASSHALHS